MSTPPRYLQYRTTLAHTVPPLESPRTDTKGADPIFSFDPVEKDNINNSNSNNTTTTNNNNNSNNPSSRFQTYCNTLKQRGVTVPVHDDNTNKINTIPNNNTDSDNNTMPTQDEDEDLLQQSSSGSTVASASPTSGITGEGIVQIAVVDSTTNVITTATTTTTTTTTNVDVDDDDDDDDTDPEANENNHLNGFKERYLVGHNKDSNIYNDDDDDDDDDDGAYNGAVQVELSVPPSRCRSPSPRFQRYRKSLEHPGHCNNEITNLTSSRSMTDEELKHEATDLQNKSLLGKDRAEWTDGEKDDEAAPPSNQPDPDSGGASPPSRILKYRDTLKQRVVSGCADSDNGPQPEKDPRIDAPSSGASTSSGSPDRYQKYRSMLASNVTDPTKKSRPWVQDARALSGLLETVTGTVDGDDSNNDNDTDTNGINNKSPMDGESSSKGDDDRILPSSSGTVNESTNRYNKYRSLLAGKVPINLSTNEPMENEANDGMILLHTPSSSVCESPERYKTYRSLLADKVIESTPEKIVAGTQTSSNQPEKTTTSVTDKLLEMTASSESCVNTSDSSSVALPFSHDGQQGSLNKATPSLLADTAVGPEAPPLPDAPLPPAGKAATDTSPKQRYSAYRSALADSLVPNGTTSALPAEPDRNPSPSHSAPSSGSLSQPGKVDKEMPSSPSDQQHDVSTRTDQYPEKENAERAPIQANKVGIPADMPGTPSRVSWGQRRDVVAAQQRVINRALASAGLVSKIEKQDVERDDIQPERPRMHDKNLEEEDDGDEEEETAHPKDIESGEVSGDEVRGMRNDEKTELQVDTETGEASETCAMQHIGRKSWQKVFLAFTIMGGLVMIIFAFITGLS